MSQQLGSSAPSVQQGFRPGTCASSPPRSSNRISMPSAEYVCAKASTSRAWFAVPMVSAMRGVKKPNAASVGPEALVSGWASGPP